MKYKEFMEQIQNYYGGYPDGSKIHVYVMNYLKRNIQEDKLQRLFYFITFSHAVRYGAPDISDMEKAIYNALRSGKGEDVHQTRNNNTAEELPSREDIDYEAGKKMLDDAGGLTAIFKKGIKKVNK